MSAIKRAAMDAFAAFFTGQPGLPTVRAVQASYEKDMEHPSVQLMPKRFTFTAFQDEELDTSVDDRLLVTVGCFEGQMEIRVSALSKHERELLQDAIWNAFNTDEYRVGVVVTQTPAVLVGGTQFLHQALAVASLTDGDGTEDWREEMVFTAERYAYLTVDVSYPALVNRQAYNIEHLSVAFTEDLTSDDPAIDEEREILQDGTEVNI